MPGSVRFRIAAAAAFTAAVVLSIAGLVLVLLVRASLIDGIDTSLVERVNDLEVAALTPLPTELPAREGDGFVQLVGPEGEVLSSTPNISGAPPLGLESGARDRIATVTDVPIDDDPFRVLTRALPDGAIVHVGTSAPVLSSRWSRGFSPAALWHRSRRFVPKSPQSGGASSTDGSRSRPSMTRSAGWPAR